MAWVVAAALCLSLGVGEATAQGRSDIDAQNFRPALGPHATFSVEHSPTLPHLQPGAKLVFDYLSEPVVRGEGETEQVIVDQQLVADVLGGIGITDRAQVGIHLPFYLVNNGSFGGDSFSGATVGDLALQPKVQLVTHDPSAVGLAARLDLTLPTGEGAAFAGAPGVGVRPQLIADAVFGGTTLAANLGGSFSPAGEVGNIDVGSRFTYGFSVQQEVVDGLVDVGAEMYGHTPFTEFFGEAEDSPLEGLLGAKLRTEAGAVISAAAGGGFSPGIGAPEFRAIVGVSYPDVVSDSDGDGISDDDDRCVDEAEDRDGFEDEDGCPDPDNDGDGIADDEDDCPDETEDMDGFEDEDGCADLDNDDDGIPDQADDCPKEPEDRNDYEDEDGCPDAELDSDGDEVYDIDDECPNEAGVEENNGCPPEQTDADGDGIADSEDECPDEPGLRANNGCRPEERKAVRKDEKIEIREKVYFQYDKAVIKEESFGVLDSVGLILRTNPDIEQVEIQGHTDDVGPSDYNEKLSEQRAKAVRQYLIDNADIAPERLEATGFGASKPLVPNNSDTNRAKNRRVEFKILDQ